MSLQQETADASGEPHSYRTSVDSRELPRFAVVVNSLDGKYQSDVLRGIRGELEGRSHLLVIVVPTLDGAGRGIERLLSRLPRRGLVEGVIVLAGALRLRKDGVERVARFYQDGLTSPVEVVSVGVAADRVPAIMINDMSGVGEAVKHLIERHAAKKIAFLCGPDGNTEAEQRFEAFHEAAAAAGAFNDDYVVKNGDFTFGWGYDKTLTLLGRWRGSVQAIMAANDEMGRGALHAVKESFPPGQRPAVIGFDGTEYAEATLPPLTTVRQPIEEEGRFAARTMLHLHQKKPAARPSWPLRTELQVRESCGCAPAPPSKLMRRDVKACVSHVVADKMSAVTIVNDFARSLGRSGRQTPLESRRPSGSRRQLQLDDLAANAERILDGRLKVATTTDIGVWQQALFRLRDGTRLMLPQSSADRERLDSLCDVLDKRVSKTGSQLAFQFQIQRTVLGQLRDALATEGESDRVVLIRTALMQLDIKNYWICRQPSSDDPSSLSTVVLSSEDGPRQFPTWRIVPRELPDEAVMYSFESDAFRGHMVFGLGEPRDWSAYTELATILSHSFGEEGSDRPATGRSRPPSEHQPGARSELEGATRPPPRRDLAGWKQFVEDKLERLRAAVPFKTASIQFVVGDARALFLASGFSEESVDRSLLRPISIDPLVSKVIRLGRAHIVPNLDTEPDWKPREPSEIASWIGIPVLHDSEPVGFVTLDFPTLDPNLERHRQHVEVFSAELALPLVRAQPLMREQEMIEVMTIVSQTVDLIAKTVDQEGVLQAIADQVAQHLNCSHCTMFFPRGQGRERQLVAEYSAGTLVTKDRRFPLHKDNESEWGVAGRVFTEGKPARLATTVGDPHFVAGRANKSDHRSMLVVPIKVGDQTIGVISADQDSYGWFHPKDERLVEALAQQAGIAIQRSQAFQFFNDIAGSIVSLQDAKTILRMVVNRAIDLVNATTGVIYQLSPDKRSIRARFHPPDFGHPDPRLELEDGLTRRIIKGGIPIKISIVNGNTQVNPQLYGRIQSMIGVPLKIEEDVIGVLYVDDEVTHDFSETEVSVLSTLASHAAIALQMATFLGERQEQLLRHERLELQLRRLHEIVRESDLDLLFSRVCECIPAILGDSISSTVNPYNADTDEFGDCHAYGPLANELRDPPRADGTGRYVLTKLYPVYHSDVNQAPEGPAIRSEAGGKQLGIKSFAAVPLKLQERPVGVLFVNSQRKLDFTPDERSLLELLASHIAIAIGNAQVQERHKSIAKAVADRINNRITKYDGIDSQLGRESEKSFPTRDKLRRIHTRVRVTTAGLKRLLIDVRRVGDRLALVLKTVSLNDIVNEAISVQREMFVQAQVQLDAVLSTTASKEILVDPVRLRQCLEQLLLNALRAVGASRRREVQVLSAIEQDWAIICVEDSGPGFPPGMRVDEPFVGTDLESSGVGLTIAKEIVSAHGGWIRRGSSQGLGGARAEIRLPVRGPTLPEPKRG